MRSMPRLLTHKQLVLLVVRLNKSIPTHQQDTIMTAAESRKINDIFNDQFGDSDSNNNLTFGDNSPGGQFPTVQVLVLMSGFIPW